MSEERDIHLHRDILEDVKTRNKNSDDIRILNRSATVSTQQGNQVTGGVPQITAQQAHGQDSKHLTFDERLGFELQKFRILDKDLTAPPGGELDGDIYIPSSVASGAWVGQEDKIAIYSTFSGWVFLTPIIQGGKYYLIP